MAVVPGSCFRAMSFIPGLANTRYDFVMSSIRSLVLLVLAAAFAVGGAPAWAQQGRGQGGGNGGSQPQPSRGSERAQPPETRDRGDQRSMSESVRWAQKTTGGQVLGAERVQSDGRDFNRVKLIDSDGRVRYMDDVPQSRRQPAPPKPDTRKPPGS